MTREEYEANLNTMVRDAEQDLVDTPAGCDSRPELEIRLATLKVSQECLAYVPEIW